MPNTLLISYDNGSHIPFFPQNIFYLAGAIKKAGFKAPAIWHQDIHHGTEKDLLRILDDAEFDFIGLGFVAGYYQYRKAKAISEAVSQSKRRHKFKYTLGGHGPAAEPEWFMEKFEADAVVVGDGEDGIVRILKGEMGLIHSAPCEDDAAPISTYNDFPLDIYRLIRWPTSRREDFCMPILSSRGCKWHCSFCYRMRKGYHMRSTEAILDEMRFLHRQVQINHFQFSDELLMASENRTTEICEAIINSGMKVKWDCNGRLNYAKPKILKLMKRAGCEYINYGIESLNQDILNGMGKGLTVDQIHRGVEATRAHNLSPGLNFIWGFPGDTVENLDLAVKFLIKYDPCDELRTIRPVTPYPGTPLYSRAIKDGLLAGTKDFYEHKHLNSDLFTVNFMDISTEKAHFHLKMANRNLYRNYLDKRWDQFGRQTDNLYRDLDTSFRGFRSV